MNKDKSQDGIDSKGAGPGSSIASKGTVKGNLIDQIPNYKEYVVTPFKAEALTSFYNIADVSKQRAKQYYSHLDIELGVASHKAENVIVEERNKLNNSFVFNSSTISEISSIEDALSSTNSNDIGISRNIVLTPMKKLCAEDELNFSKSLSKVLIDSDQSQSEDSFSSSPGTNFNQGAEKFIALVEKQLEAVNNISGEEAENCGLLFEKVVVDMMDLSLNEGVLTSTDIPGILAKKGWNFKQVANTWTVPSGYIPWDTWTFDSLDYLGGKNCLSKVWNVLRDENLKRKHLSPSPVKSMKLLKYDMPAAKVYVSNGSSQLGDIHIVGVAFNIH